LFRQFLSEEYVGIPAQIAEFGIGAAPASAGAEMGVWVT